MTAAKVVIVDDHPVVRSGLGHLISQEPGLELAGGADGPREALDVIETLKPDIVVIDISLKDGNGIELIKQIKARDEGVKMLVWSMHDELVYAERVLRAGAMGYINKVEAPDNVIEAIHQVLNDKIYLSQRMSDRLLHRMFDRDEEPIKTPIGSLSDRELEVFELIGQGLSTRQIADRLCLSVKTVETHRENIKKKLGLETNFELIRYSLQWVMEMGQSSSQEATSE